MGTHKSDLKGCPHFKGEKREKTHRVIILHNIKIDEMKEKNPKKKPNMQYGIFVDRLQKNKKIDLIASNICQIKKIQQCSDTNV